LRYANVPVAAYHESNSLTLKQTRRMHNERT